jgi:hypothetical protein
LAPQGAKPITVPYIGIEEYCGALSSAAGLAGLFCLVITMVKRLGRSDPFQRASALISIHHPSTSRALPRPPQYYTILAIALSLPMPIVGIRSLAETDYNPESALGMLSLNNHTKLRLQCSIVSQLVFATLISRSDPNAIIINLLSAAVAQAGANQAGDISFDFKIGSLVGARPEAQIYGHSSVLSYRVAYANSMQFNIPYPDLSSGSHRHSLSLVRRNW